MTPEEKTAHDALIAKVESTIKAANESKADKTVIEGLTKELNDLKEAIKNAKPENYDTLIQEHADLMAEVKALKETGTSKSEGHKTLDDALMAAFKEKATEIDEAVKNGQKAPIKITVKTVGVMSLASTIEAGSTQVSITEDTGIVSTIRKRELTYLAEVSVGRIGTSRAMWIEETDEEGTPIMIAEGATKTQLDVQYVEQTMSVKKIAVFGKVTTELMADLPQLISYIKNNLMKRMDIVMENQLFSGNGVGDNLKGLSEYATAFTGGSLALSVDTPNELDVLEAIALQVKEAFGIASGVFIHPSTMAKIKLLKDENKRPLWKDYVTIQGEMVISGMKIIETTAVTAGNFIGGDLSVVNVLIRSELGVQIGLDGSDFTKNLKTMLLEKRLVQFVSGNDLAVIVDGDFATAKTAITGAP